MYIYIYICIYIYIYIYIYICIHTCNTTRRRAHASITRITSTAPRLSRVDSFWRLARRKSAPPTAAPSPLFAVLLLHVVRAPTTPYRCLNKNTPPDKKRGWKISSESTKSGAGLQFPLLGRMAKAHVEGVSCFTDTGNSHHQGQKQGPGPGVRTV